MAKAFLFDLDNTLYDQSEYYRQAYGAVADYLACRCEWDRDLIFNRLFQLWTEHGSLYGHLFDDILKETNARTVCVRELIEAYHGTDIDGLQPYPGIESLLDMLVDAPTGIITNGHAAMQEAKVRSLGFENRFGVIEYTDRAGRPKPDRYCYEQVAEALGVPATECVYVGDNPPVDFPGAKVVGMETVWLRLGEFSQYVGKDERYVDHVVCSIGELVQLVENLQGGKDAG